MSDKDLETALEAIQRKQKFRKESLKEKDYNDVREAICKYLKDGGEVEFIDSLVETIHSNFKRQYGEQKNNQCKGGNNNERIYNFYLNLIHLWFNLLYQRQFYRYQIGYSQFDNCHNFWNIWCYHFNKATLNRQS